jgi:hypothetical protein
MAGGQGLIVLVQLLVLLRDLEVYSFTINCLPSVIESLNDHISLHCRQEASGAASFLDLGERGPLGPLGHAAAGVQCDLDRVAPPRSRSARRAA